MRTVMTVKQAIAALQREVNARRRSVDLHVRMLHRLRVVQHRYESGEETLVTVVQGHDQPSVYKVHQGSNKDAAVELPADVEGRRWRSG